MVDNLTNDKKHETTILANLRLTNTEMTMT